ncbi:MAG: hypothetical protein WDM81_21875 [Rhizomicrobium sp.]
MSIPPDRLKRWIAGYDAVLEGGVPMRFLSYFEIPRVSYLNGESFYAPVVQRDQEADHDSRPAPISRPRRCRAPRARKDPKR